MEIHEITTKIIGPIGAVGDRNSDQTRYENLEVTIGLVEELIYDLTRAAQDKDRPEASMSRIGKRAQGFLYDLRDSLPENNEDRHEVRNEQS